MKYLFNSVTKLIIFLLALSLMLCLCSCGKGGEDDADNGASSENGESSAIIENDGVFTLETARKLLEQDRMVTEIFVGDYLWDTSLKSAERSLVPIGRKYGRFSEIEELIQNTYLPDSGDKEFFISFPQNQEPSVTSGKEGRTSIFRHAGSGYEDYADYDTLSVSDTDNEAEKLISFATLSGKEMQVKAFRGADGKWLLEKGIYRLNPPQEKTVEGDLSKTNQGSFKSLSGKILVVQLFVSDKGAKLKSEDEEIFHQKVVSATDRIAENAATFGLSPQFDYASCYFEHKSVLGTRSIDFDIMMAQTNFGNLQTFAQANLDLSGYDNYFFVVCVKNDAEATWESCDGTEDTQLHYGERVIAFSSSTDLDIYKSMICLLGADPREDESADQYIESLYRFYFPNDFVSSDNLSTAEFSPVTALMCGITDELDSLYHIFIPKNK